MSNTITSIRVTNGTNERIKKIAKEYSKISVDITLEFILDYLERNSIDLNFDVKNEFYSDLKINQNKFDDFTKLLLKREEGIVKILRRFEKDYFIQISKIDNLIPKEIINNNIEQSNNVSKYLLDKISIEESPVTGKKKFVLNISEKEFEELKLNEQ